VLLSLSVGSEYISVAKFAGITLALIAFVPVFIMLKTSLTKADTNLVLGVFVGGMFFKLLVLLAGIWAGVQVVGFPKVDLAIPAVSFVFAFQIFESLYFWSRQK